MRTMALLVYGSYFANFFIPLICLAGLILAYIKRPEAEGTIYASHFEWNIRTFWIGLIGVVISLPLLLLFGLGMILMLAIAVWALYRMVIGTVKAYERKPIPDPKAWF